MQKKSKRLAPSVRESANLLPKSLRDLDDNNGNNYNNKPQGSILGPLLFTILVSDIRQYIPFGSYHSYADDLQLYIPIKSANVNDNIELINEDLNRIGEYCKRSALKINEGKCFYMFLGSRQGIKSINEIPLKNITINKTPIKRVDFVKNLGLTFDEILSWRKHINLCIKRAMGNFITLSRFKRFLSVEAKLMLCESMVLSQFNFCDVVYLNIDIYLQKKIQRMQDLCLRFIFNIKRDHNCNYDELRNNLRLLDMNQRRISHGLVMLFKILKGIAPTYLRDSFTQISEIRTRITRSFDGNIYIPNTNFSARHRKAFHIYISRVWNCLPDDVKSCTSVFSFKNQIKKIFLTNSLVLPPP